MQTPNPILHSPIMDTVPHLLPQAMRIASLSRQPDSDRKSVRNEALLCHDKATIRVFWITSQPDIRLKVGQLVAIRWLGKSVSVDGAIRISRLVLLERTIPTVNLFESIPSEWVLDRELLQRASMIWQQISYPFQHLINTILWDAGRLYRFLVGPSSLSGHHNRRNGNFLHSVETAEQCLILSRTTPNVSRAVLLTAALLHDVGKADEYRLEADQRAYRMSERGVLIGHRHTILEWIAAARARERIIIPETHYLALLHALTAGKGAEWLGIREPVSIEALLLSTADRLSGQIDLVDRMAPNQPGFGEYHKHLKGKPYVIGADHDRLLAIAA